MIDTVKFARGQIYWRESNVKQTTPGVISKTRPVLIISNNVGNALSKVCLVAPITSAPRRTHNPTQVEVNINGTKSWILTEQTVCVNQETFCGYIATLTELKMEEVNDAIKFALGLVPANELYRSEKESEEQIQVPSDADRIEKTKAVDTIKSEPLVVDESKVIENPVNESSTDGKESVKRVRRKNFTEEEKLAYVIAYENAGKDKIKRQKMMEDWKITNMSILINYYKRFKASLGV